tara:strand:- start:2222 stop:2476 length:255 start_codon:yes stop_codon:yes gene_type:complete
MKKKKWLPKWLAFVLILIFGFLSISIFTGFISVLVLITSWGNVGTQSLAFDLGQIIGYILSSYLIYKGLEYFVLYFKNYNKLEF